jgi:hypothetical protein
MKIIEHCWTTTKGEPAFLIYEAHSLAEFISKVRSGIDDNCDVFIYRNEPDIMNDSEITLEAVIEVDEIQGIDKKVVCFDRIFKS